MIAQAEIVNHYTLRNSSEVLHFIAEHPSLEPLLVEAYKQLEKHFGAKVPVTLKVVYDPEYVDVVQLFGYIKTNLSPQAALDRLDAFDKAWFLSVLDQADGLLNFNLEFV